MGKKDEKEYLAFANLGQGVCANPKDLPVMPSVAEVNEFMRGRDLGLNPWRNGPSWDYQGRFFMYPGEPLPGGAFLTGPKPETLIPAWGIENVFFSRWENKPPQNADSVPEINETPGIVRQEAQRMLAVIVLFGMIKECTDETGHLSPDMILASPRSAEITGLVDLLFCRFPGSFDAFWLDLDPDSPIAENERIYKKDKTVVKLPNFQKFFDSILTRVRFRVTREGNNLGDGGIIFSESGYQTKNIFGFDIRKGHPGITKDRLEIDEGCLLARLWYECISDLLSGRYPPRRCLFCQKLFSPSKPNAEYCCPEHQKAAQSRRQRKEGAKKKGRMLRPGPGRPPKYAASG